MTLVRSYFWNKGHGLTKSNEAIDNQQFKFVIVKREKKTFTLPVLLESIRDSLFPSVENMKLEAGTTRIHV